MAAKYEQYLQPNVVLMRLLLFRFLEQQGRLDRTHVC